MIKTLLLVVTLLLAVSGLCEFIHGVRIAFISPKRRGRTFAVVWLSPGNAAQQMYLMIEKFRWSGKKYADHLIAVSSDINGDELTNCKKIAEKNQITLCPVQVLEHIVETVSEEFWK